MSLNYKDLKAVLYDKKMRAELKKDPEEFLGDDSPYKKAKEYKVITSTNKITYVAIPHLGVPPLEEISAAGNRPVADCLGGLCW